VKATCLSIRVAVAIGGEGVELGVRHKWIYSPIVLGQRYLQVAPLLPGYLLSPPTEVFRELSALLKCNLRSNE